MPEPGTPEFEEYQVEKQRVAERHGFTPRAGKRPFYLGRQVSDGNAVRIRKVGPGSAGPSEKARARADAKRS